MFNTVNISGRLVRDPEVRTTTTGTAVASFTIANETGWGNNKKTNFIPCVMFKNAADTVGKYLKKGNMVGVQNGELQMRKYEDKDGNNRTVFEVVGGNLVFMEGKTFVSADAQEEPSYSNGDAEDFTDVGSDDDLPF